MSFTEDELKAIHNEEVNPRRKRGKRSQRLDHINTEAVNASGIVLQSGLNALAVQAAQFDNGLTQLEVQAARQMAERVRQIPARVAIYLSQELAEAETELDLSEVVTQFQLPDIANFDFSTAKALMGA